jgi:hypothetical protein
MRQYSVVSRRTCSPPRRARVKIAGALTYVVRLSSIGQFFVGPRRCIELLSPPCARLPRLYMLERPIGTNFPMKLPLSNRVTMTHRVVSAVPPGPGLFSPKGSGPFNLCRACASADMRVQLKRRPDPAAALKVQIIQLQERAALLARAGKTEEARKARATLIVLLNQLDLLKAAS